MSRITEILRKLETKDRQEKLQFYERLGFSMTICIRSICADERTTAEEKLEAVKTINELSHRIFNWIWKLRQTDQEFVDADCFSTMKSYAHENRIAAAEIGAVLNSRFTEIDDER